MKFCSQMYIFFTNSKYETSCGEAAHSLLSTYKSKYLNFGSSHTKQYFVKTLSNFKHQNLLNVVVLVQESSVFPKKNLNFLFSTLALFVTFFLSQHIFLTRSFPLDRQMMPYEAPYMTI